MDYLSPYLESLGQGVQVVQQLRQAAQQQQELAERKRQFDAEMALRQTQNTQGQAHQQLADKLNLLTSGAQPVSQGSLGPETTQTQPMAGPPVSLVPGGPSYQPATTARAPVDPGRVVAAPGSSQQYYVPTQQETAERELGDKVKQARAIRAVTEEGYPSVEGDLAEAAGLAPGTKVAPAAYSAIARLSAAMNKPQPEKAPKTTVTLTDKDAKLIGMNAGTEVPIDEYKARTQMVAEDLRAQQQASRDAKSGAAKAPSPTQMRVVRSKFDDTLASSKKQLDKDLKDGTLDASGVRDAYTAHVGRMQEAQKAYESELGTLGLDVGHNDWADREMQRFEEQAAAQQKTQQQQQQAKGKATPAATPAAAAKPQYKVGDTVNYQGKPHKITGIDAKGKLTLQPQ